MRASRRNFNKRIIFFVLLGILSLNLSQVTTAEEVKSKENTTVQTQAPLKGQAVMIDLNSDKLEYFQERDEFVATGSAEITIDEQNSKLEANKITYDQTNQLIIAEDSVKITKNGQVILGKYAKIDLTKESALINDPNAIIGQIKIKANIANVYPKELELLKGRAIVNNKDLMLTLSSNEFTPQWLVNSKPLSTDTDVKPNYRIVAKEIIVDPQEDKNVIIIKNADILIGKIKVATIPSLELTTDKEVSRMETKIPEFGRTPELGTYIGQGHVFNLPHGSTLKATPIVSFGNGGGNSFGVGAIARYTSSVNKTEAAYSTLENKLVVKGEHSILSPYTKIVYGSNTFMNEGIFGDARPKYLAEIVDYRRLASALNHDFYLRSSAGYAEDEYREGFGTTKFQLQGTLISNKPIFNLYNDLLSLSFISQFNIAAYGTGDTFGILRAGPMLGSKIGPLSIQSIYFQAGVYGCSPFYYDRFIQGKSNVIATGDLKLTKYLSIGHLRNLNLSKDNWEKKLSTESQFYARVGPDDFKLRIGYDTIRKRSTFGIDLLLGSGKTALDFDKMKINQEHK